MELSKEIGNMNSIHFYMNIVRRLVLLPTKKKRYYLCCYTFAYYVIARLRRLLVINSHWSTLSDDVLRSIVKRIAANENYYLDYDSCLLGNIEYLEVSAPTLYYIFSKVSLKKYKVLVLPTKDVDANTILISETAKHSIENALHTNSLTDTCFLLPIVDDNIDFAIEAKISLISNPYECTNSLLDTLLANYFREPHFLRKNDIFSIDVKEYAPDLSYFSTNHSISKIHFQVRGLRIAGNKEISDGNGCYVVFGETTLIQEPNVQRYLPRRHSYSSSDHNLQKLLARSNAKLIERYPSCLSDSLDHLRQCILPFIKKGIQLRLKPVFLVKGPKGSGKHELIQILSETMGLHFLNVDVAEVQALTSAQTEAKLRIVLHNAEQTVPCILCLNNIEVFGKNAEGQKDERIISAFTNEINALYDKDLKYPVIVIAASGESELPPELQRMFIETINIPHLDQHQRTDLLSWLLKKQDLKHEVDLSKVAGMCSDFGLSDFTALISHALKIHTKHSAGSVDSTILVQRDFDEAYEYMQSIYSDSKGAPRVPKVNWEDIGGLADLKHEIMRRIQLPLLNALGFGQSGLLLYGPPGTGKTLLAKAVATEYQLHFLSIKGPEVLNMYVGQSEKNVRQIFERARAAAPCIIFFDELDSLAPNRGRSGDSAGVMDRVVSQLLAEMDGLEGTSSIFIIGATNRPDLIDPALLRPGRFDKMLYVGIHSDRSSQLGVLRALTRKFKLRENGEELEQLVNQLPAHLTGADLYAVCSDAWLSSARKILSQHIDDQQSVPKEHELRSDITVELQDFIDAARNLVPSVSEEEAERYKRMHMELSSAS